MELTFRISRVFVSEIRRDSLGKLGHAENVTMSAHFLFNQFFIVEMLVFYCKSVYSRATVRTANCTMSIIRKLF